MQRGILRGMIIVSESWQPPPSELSIPTDRVDVWRVPLDTAELSSAALLSTLAMEEAARAARFRFNTDHRRFVSCRLALRILLGRYLDVVPREIQFQYESNGRPELSRGQNPSKLRFNVSHSGEVGLIAVTVDRAIGVDVEAAQADHRNSELAGRFFSKREVESLEALPDDKRERAFLACWVRKEAFLKATGAGLTFGLSEFSVSVDPDAPAELLEVSEEADTVNDWYLADLYPGNEFVAALCLEGTPRGIEYWGWRDELASIYL